MYTCSSCGMESVQPVCLHCQRRRSQKMRAPPRVPARERKNGRLNFGKRGEMDELASQLGKTLGIDAVGPAPVASGLFGAMSDDDGDIVPLTAPTYKPPALFMASLDAVIPPPRSNLATQEPFWVKYFEANYTLMGTTTSNVITLTNKLVNQSKIVALPFAGTQFVNRVGATITIKSLDGSQSAFVQINWQTGDLSILS